MNNKDKNINTDADINIIELEDDDLTLEKELDCAKKEIEKKSWEELDVCLNKFLIKLQQEDSSREEIEKYKKLFFEIKELLRNKDMPSKTESIIKSSLNHIDKLLK